MSDTVLKPYIIEHNGCALHYWMTGPEQAPLVIFTHGIGVDHHMFDAQIEALGRVCRVLVWDMRGHGQSQPKGRAFSTQVAANDLLALLQHTGYTRAILAGVSIGGNIALLASALVPQAVTALVLVGTGNPWLALTRWNRFCLHAMKLYVHTLPLPLFQRIFSFLASTRQQVRRSIYHSWRHMRTKDFVEVWEEFGALYRERPARSLSCSARPTLIVCGRYDITANYQRQWELWEYAPEYLSCVTIPGAGHLAHCDNPAHFNRILIEYVSQFAEQKSDALQLGEIDVAVEPV